MGTDDLEITPPESGIDKREMERLRDSETRYRRLFEAAQDGILILDADTGQITDVNPFLTEMLGFSKEELLGKTLWEIGPFKDTITSKSAFNKLKHRKYIRYEDLPLETSSGERREVEFVSNVYEVDDKKVIQCNIRDITERKRAEEALQASQRLFRTLAQVAPVGVFHTDVQGDCIYVNERWQAIAGMTEAEALGAGWSQAIHPQDRLDVNTEWYRCISEKLPFKMEYRFQRPDGTVTWVLGQAQAELDARGEMIGYVGIITDINERQQAQKALTESERKLDRMLQTMVDGMVMVDLTGQIVYANHAAERILEISKDEIVGRYYNSREWHQIDEHGQPFPSDQLPLAVAMRERRDVEAVEHPIISPDGEIKWISAKAAPLFDEHGQLYGAVASFEDISGRKQAEAALRKERDRAQSYLNIAGVIIVAIDIYQKVTLINAWGCQILGCREDEILGANWFDTFIPERVRDEVKASFAQLLAGDIEPVEYFENPVLTRDGEEHLIAWHNVLLQDETGRLLGSLSSGEDITDRRRAEQQIESLAKFPEENPNPVMRIDRDGRLLYANKASRLLQEEWGCEIGQVAPQMWRDLAVEALSTQTQKDLNATCGEITFGLLFSPILETGYVNIYGRDVSEWISASQNLQKAHEELELRVQERTQELLDANERLSVEITERKRAQESLRLANAYNRSLIEASLDPLVTILPDGKIGDVNAATEAVTGYSRQELIGTDFHGYFTDPEKARAGYQQVFESGTVRDYELEIRHKDGRITPVLYTASVYHDEAGAMIGVFAAARDITERKKAEQDLRQQEALFRAVLELLPVGVWITDPAGKIMLGNPSGQRIWAGARYVGPEEFGVYKGWWVSTGKRIEANEWAAARAVKKGEISLNEEIEIECFDGTHKIILNSAIPLRDEEQNIRGAIIVNQDITERKQMEIALRESEERYRSLVETSPDSIILTDLNQKILFANQQAASMHGFERAVDLIGLNIVDLVAEEDRNRFYQDAQMITEKGILRNIEYTFLRKDGTRFPADLSVSVVLDTQNRPIAFQRVKRDITQRKLVEQGREADRQRLLVLSQAERDQRLFAESLAQATLDLNSSLDLNEVLDHILDRIQLVIPFRTADITLLDNQMVHVVRYRGFEDLPQAQASLQGSFSLEAFTLWKTAFHSHRAVVVADTQSHPDWVVVPGLEWARSYIVAPLPAGELIVGFLNLVSDQPSFFNQEAGNRLTAFASQAALAIQNARLYEELENALEQEHLMHDQLVQAEKFAAMGHLLASVAHELNNPLQTIQNVLYLTQEDTPPDSPVQEYLKMAFSEIKRLTNLVAQLRQLYRPRTTSVHEPHRIDQILEEVRNLLAPHLQNQLVTWQQSPAPEGLIVNCDPDQIKQIFINLSMNAIEAMQPDGGTLFVRPVLAEDGSQAGIIFQDTGPGMTPEMISHLFEPFFTTKSNGLGLGLPICYELIQRHQGQIKVESQAGQGTTFTVWLPLAKE